MRCGVTSRKDRQGAENLENFTASGSCRDRGGECGYNTTGKLSKIHPFSGWCEGTTAIIGVLLEYLQVVRNEVT